MVTPTDRLLGWYRTSNRISNHRSKSISRRPKQWRPGKYRQLGWKWAQKKREKSRGERERERILVLTSNSVFKNLKSTFDKIKAPNPSAYTNPNVHDDPRADAQTSEPAKSAKIYRPYPDYESQEWKRTHRGSFVPCIGPRGKKLTESLDDNVGVYVGIPEGKLIYLLFSMP